MLYENKNYISFALFTNNDNPIIISPNERRFFATECNNSMCNNSEYFNALYEEINSGEYDRAFYDYFMSLNFENYNFIQERPRTLFYERMQELNIPTMAQFLENLIDSNTQKAHFSYSSSNLFSLFNEIPFSLLEDCVGLNFFKKQFLLLLSVESSKLIRNIQAI